MSIHRRLSDRDCNVFEVLNDGDNESRSVSSPRSIETAAPDSALSEVAGNKTPGTSRLSPDDVALQLDGLHLVTPGKINKTRGLKPRRTLDQSIFSHPTDEQENKSIAEVREADRSGTPSKVGQEELVQFLHELEDFYIPSDSTQLAKHQAGQFEYVLTLPAVITTRTTDVGENQSSPETPDANQDITTVQFGCNIVRADGSDGLQHHNRPESAGTYTVVATPLQSDGKTATEESAELVAEKAENMATTTVTEVASGLDQDALMERPLREPTKGPVETTLEIQQRPDSVPVAPVSELSDSTPVEADTTLVSEDEEVPARVDITTGQISHAEDSQPQGLRAWLPAGFEHVKHIDRPGAVHAHNAPSVFEPLSNDSSDVLDDIMSLPSAPGPSSRIEDSVETLDKLEEHLENMDKASQVEHELSAEVAITPVTIDKANTPRRRTTLTDSKPTAKPVASGAARAATVRRGASVRHSMAVPPSKQAEQTAAASRAAANKRLSVVSRPASLAPPNPPTRSSKPPTTSNFELPGEAVAQRLKEKRLARLSMSMPPSTPGQRTASPSKPAKTASSKKPPTVPNFELPGEAISRRKREEREARLKSEQEEERRRREFKARPVRASIVQGAAGGTFPRQTAASRARISLKATMAAAEAEQQAASTASKTPSAPSAGASANKRHSTIGYGMSSRPSLSVSTTSTSTGTQRRGRASVASATLTPSTATSATRATSTSTGTGSVRGSVAALPLSAEEVAQQKQRGREIFRRESSFAGDRERERRSREDAARRAREEAAERSRTLSRVWAEKQKRKAAAAQTGARGAGGPGPSFVAA